MICKIPYVCACGYVDPYAASGSIPIVMRWCGACGEAICPTCFPPGQADAISCRCRRCITEDRKLSAFIAGEKAAYERELRFWKGFSRK